MVEKVSGSSHVKSEKELMEAIFHREQLMSKVVAFPTRFANEFASAVSVHAKRHPFLFHRIRSGIVDVHETEETFHRGQARIRHPARHAGLREPPI